MNIRVKFLAIVAILSVSIFTIYAKDFNFKPVDEFVSQVKDNFASLKTYKARFSISIKQMGKTKFHDGTIMFKAPNKLLMNFSNPNGQKVISNGKMMWIYIPSMNVVAEQDLESDSGLFTSNSRSGLQRLFSKYHFRYDSSEKPVTGKDGKKYYVLNLRQKERRAGYRTLKLWIDMDYFIVRAKGKTSSGKEVDIKFDNLEKNTPMRNGLFKFDIPPRARVIKNPMISEG